MARIDDLAAWLGNRTARGTTEIGATSTLMGEAISDSDVNGNVQVAITDDNWNTGADEDIARITIPTTVAVHRGDHVIVTMYGASDSKKPIVTGVTGGGNFLESGVISVKAVANTVSTVTITFDRPFNTTPIVVALPMTNHPEKWSVSVWPVNNASAKIQFYCDSAWTTTIQWFAVRKGGAVQ